MQKTEEGFVVYVQLAILSDLSFYGDKVVIFYEFIFGTYPYYKGYNENQSINGGTPQV